MKLRLLRSFRWRIALLTAGISGSVVVGSVLWVYGSIQENSRRRVDDQIGRFANPLLGRPGQIDWTRAEADLAQTTGLETEAWPVLLVQDFEGNPLHQSAPWPAGLTPEIVRSHRIEPPQRGPGEGPQPESPLPPRRHDGLVEPVDPADLGEQLALCDDRYPVGVGGMQQGR